MLAPLFLSQSRSSLCWWRDPFGLVRSSARDGETAGQGFLSIAGAAIWHPNTSTCGSAARQGKRGVASFFCFSRQSSLHSSPSNFCERVFGGCSQYLTLSYKTMELTGKHAPRQCKEEVMSN